MSHQLRIGRRAYAFEFALFAGSTAAFQASRLAIGLVAASLLPPAEYGFWGLFLAILSYSNFANLGLISGANRELPISIGAGNVERSSQIERAAFGGALVAGAAVSLVAAVLYLPGRGLLGLLVALALGSQQIYLFYQVSLRSRLEFNRASTQQLILAIVFLIVGALLLARWRLVGLVGAQLASFAVACSLGLLFWRPHLRPAIWPGEIARLLRSGFPIMLAGLAFAVLTTADRWIVALALGNEALGHYTLAALLSSAALLLATVIGQQFYPRMGIRLGETGSARALFPMAVRQSILVVAAVTPLALAVALLAPPIIRGMLPSYVSSIPAVQVLAVAIVPLVAASGFTNMLVASGRAAAYLLVQLAAVAVEIACAGITILLGWGLVGIALSASVGYVSLCLGALLLAWSADRS